MSLPLLNAGPSAPGSGRPPTAPPLLTVEVAGFDAPLNLTATLDWNPVARATGYTVWLGIDVVPDPGVDSPLATLGNVLTYQDYQGAAGGETYNYIIRATNAGGEGPNSNVASVILPGE